MTTGQQSRRRRTTIHGTSGRLEISDGSKVKAKDVVWIKHEQCLDTPVIVQKVFVIGKYIDASLQAVAN